MARPEGKARGDPPRVLHNAHILVNYLPIYRRWKAAGKGMTLTEILTLPGELIDALFTLSWVDQSVNREKDNAG